MLVQAGHWLGSCLFAESPAKRNTSGMRMNELPATAGRRPADAGAGRPLAGLRVCCVLSTLLGNRTFSERLLEVAGKLVDAEPEKVWFSPESYRRYPARRPLRLSSELEAEAVFRRMLATEPLPAADAYLVNGAGLAAVAIEHAPAARWIVATDATPALTDRLRRAGYGESSNLPRRAFRLIQGMRFRRFARRVDLWLPMSEASAESLVEDYGVAARHCLVTSAPQREVDATLPVRDPRERPYRLLFVGGDFERKGGPLLCRAVQDLEQVTLTVVSADPAARPFHDGKRIIVAGGVSGPEALRELYRTSHLLVHPTRIDHYSHVICEGLARGLPFLVSAMTPAAELLRSGAGVRLPTPLHPQSIRDTISALMADPDRHEQMARAALDHAHRHLALDGFRDRLAQALITVL
jgi:glycosyltransferase involved in cell wall biosynthesis